MDDSEDRDRLLRLEAEVRRLRRFVPMLVAGFALLLIWQFIPGPATIEARRFLVRDEQGVSRAEMVVGPEGRPMFRLNDRFGKARAMFYLNPERGGNLRFTDTTGYHRLQMMLRETGEPQIWLGNEGGRTRTYVGIGDHTTPAFQAAGEDLKWIWWAPGQ